MAPREALALPMAASLLLSALLTLFAVEGSGQSRVDERIDRLVHAEA